MGMHGRIKLGILTVALAAVCSAPLGCATTRAVGDAFDRIVTGEEDAITKANRALATAYATHKAATRTVRQAYLSGAMSREDAIKALGGLTKALDALDYARSLIRLGDATSGMDELARAEAIISAVLLALPEN